MNATKTKATQVTYECPRCCGSGNIGAFAHVMGGVCFRCQGHGRVSGRTAKENKFSAINAMHCETLAEAHAFRISVFCERFPELVEKLQANQEVLHWVKNCMGNLKALVEKLA